jgi:hypothetical protein
MAPRDGNSVGRPPDARRHNVDLVGAQQLGRSTRHALIEDQLHDAVGSSAFSSPTIAAA